MEEGVIILSSFSSAVLIDGRGMQRIYIVNNKK